MRSGRMLWLWRAVWGAGILSALVVPLMYARLPADGATGDLESFTPEGFHVQWLLEKRPGGLCTGDIIVRAGGHTIDEWLGGAAGGEAWDAGAVIPYEILRNGQQTTVQVELLPIGLQAILQRWWAQLCVSVAFACIGSFVFLKRPYDAAAHLFMLFCVAVVGQMWIDAYNFQYAILVRRPLFWLRLALEYGTFIVTYAALLNFALVFPVPHLLARGFLRFILLGACVSHALVVAGVMALSPTWPQALRAGSHASWLVASTQAVLCIVAGVHSIRTLRDPVARSQMRWVLWGIVTALGAVVLVYMLPLALFGRALIPHPVSMLLIGLIPAVLAVPILRYRLFDIEVVINRTLVYATLTALLGGLYLLLVRILTAAVHLALHHPDDVLVAMLSTVGIMLAFNPLRRRVQGLIDSALYRRKLDYENLLPEMTERLVTSVVLDQLAEPLTVEIPRRLQVEEAALWVLDRDGERFVPVQGSVRQGLAADHPLADSLSRLGRPLVRLQPPANLASAARTWLEQHRVELIIPLPSGNELVGFYSLGRKLSGEAYNGEEIRLLRLLGQQAAVGVQNGRLFRAEREQRELAEALQEAADVVGSTLNLEQVLDHILEQVQRVVAGDAFNIMFLEGQIARVIRWRGYDRFGLADRMNDSSVPIDGYLTLQRMVEEGRPVLLPDTVEEPAWICVAGWDWLRSYVAAPIRIAGQVVGFLNVDGTQVGQFSPADARRLEAFAGQAATAIANARLFQDVHQKADELEKAVARLKELDRLKSEFVQNVSHELRSPLALVRGYAELLSSGELGQLSPEQQRSVEVIARRAQMLGALVEDIVLILLAERRALVKEPVALGEMVSTVVEEFQTVAARAGVTMRAEVAPNLPAVNGASLHLRRVLDNLIANAIKFTPAGGRITVRVRGDDTQIILQVKDTGIGISADQQTRLFQRFYQVDGSSTRRYGGVGLGLALVKEIVEAHDGSVTVDSRTGVGSTFTVALPVSGEPPVVRPD